MGSGASQPEREAQGDYDDARPAGLQLDAHGLDRELHELRDAYTAELAKTMPHTLPQGLDTRVSRPCGRVWGMVLASSAVYASRSSCSSRSRPCASSCRPAGRASS